MKLRSIRLLNNLGVPQSTFESDKPITVEVEYEVLQRMRGVRFCLFLHTQEGEMAFGATDHLFQQETLMPGTYKTSCLLPGGLLNRRQYVVHLQCDIPGERYVLPATEYLSFTVSGIGNQSSNFPGSWPGVVCPRISWKVEEIKP
jgi:lipopolysaccharide transport system ATP-binding protein